VLELSLAGFGPAVAFGMETGRAFFGRDGAAPPRPDVPRERASFPFVAVPLLDDAVCFLLEDNTGAALPFAGIVAFPLAGVALGFAFEDTAEAEAFLAGAEFFKVGADFFAAGADFDADLPLSAFAAAGVLAVLPFFTGGFTSALPELLLFAAGAVAFALPGLAAALAAGFAGADFAGAALPALPLAPFMAVVTREGAASFAGAAFFVAGALAPVFERRIGAATLFFTAFPLLLFVETAFADRAGAAFAAIELLRAGTLLLEAAALPFGGAEAAFLLAAGFAAAFFLARTMLRMPPHDVDTSIA
jgi:hypothetical protein